MKMERFNAPPLSFEELQDLDKLKRLIEQAVADGKVTKAEMESIKAAIAADGKVSFEELELCQNLIWSKVQNGELEVSW
ncbi:MAG TPA: hypothetical protein V6C65_10200 [Allocoleopsis sp.]